MIPFLVTKVALLPPRSRNKRPKLLINLNLRCCAVCKVPLNLYALSFPPVLGGRKAQQAGATDVHRQLLPEKGVVKHGGVSTFAASNSADTGLGVLMYLASIVRTEAVRFIFNVRNGCLRSLESVLDYF